MPPNKQPLQLAKEALDKALETERRNKSLIASLGPAIVGTIQPVLDELRKVFKDTIDEIKSTVASIKVETPIIPEITVPPIKVELPTIIVPEPKVTVNVPEIKLPPFPEIKLPTINVPEAKVTVKVPDIKIPDIIFPEELQTRGWLEVVGWDKGLLANPIPVQLRDAKGAPLNLFENLTQIINQGGGGGGPRFVKINNSASEPIPITGSISASFAADFGQGATGAETLRVVAATDSFQSVNVVDAFGSTSVGSVFNADNRIRVSVETGGSGLTDSELRASSVPVAQASGAVWSTFLTGSSGTVGVVTIDPDGNPTYASATSGLTDAELRASSVPVAQASGASWSVSAQDALTTTSATSLVNGDNRLRVSVETGGSGLTDSELRASAVPVSQVSGSAWSVSVNDIFGSTAANLINPDNRLKVELPTGSSGLTDTELRATSVPVEQVSGSAWSVFIAGALATVGVVTINPDGSPTYSSSSSGLTDTELRASSVPVEQVSGSTWSTSIASQPITFDVKQVSGSSDSVNVLGTVTVTAADLDIRDLVNTSDSVSAYQVSGHRWSTEATQSGTWNIGTVTTVTGVTNSVAVVALDRDGNPLTTGPIGQGDEATALRVVHAGNSAVSVTATQTGTWNIGTVTTVTGVTNTLASNIVDSTGVAYSGSNPVPVTWVSGAGVSTAVHITDSGGVGYSGSNPVPVTGTVVVSSVTASTAASMVDSSGVMYGSANPFHIAVHDSTGSTISSFPSGDIKGLAVAIVDGSGNQITSFGGGTQYAEGATASTYTGTAVMFAEASSDAAKVVSSVDPLPVTLSTALSSSIDSVLARPISLRGSLSTAYATLSSNAETTLISASAGNYLDLVWVKFSNTSTGAVTLDLRDVSAGNIVDTYEVPANGVVGISMAVPYPQGNQGNAWTVDYNDSDLSNTTVYVSALFHKTT